MVSPPSMEGASLYREGESRVTHYLTGAPQYWVDHWESLRGIHRLHSIGRGTTDQELHITANSKKVHY